MCLHNNFKSKNNSNKSFRVPIELGFLQENLPVLCAGGEVTDLQGNKYSAEERAYLVRKIELAEKKLLDFLKELEECKKVLVESR